MWFGFALMLIGVFFLFSLSGFLFPNDPQWYQQLKKPATAPSGRTIGIIWAVLYILIAISITITVTKTGWTNLSADWKQALVLNYITNQAFSYLFFRQKNLYLSFIDALLVMLTAVWLTLLTVPYSLLAAFLLIPYIVWTAFATYLSWRIYRMNR